MAEAKSRGERLPTIDELLTVTNSLPGNCEEKVEALSLSFDGCRIRISNSGEFSNDGIISYLWASSPNGDDNARYIYLHRDDDHAIAFWGDRGHGLPVRPFR